MRQHHDIRIGVANARIDGAEQPWSGAFEDVVVRHHRTCGALQHCFQHIQPEGVLLRRGEHVIGDAQALSYAPAHRLLVD